MRCNDLQDQINAFAAGDLDSLRARRLRRHLEQCPICSGRLQRARTTALELTTLSIAAPSDLLRQRVFTDLEFLASRAADEESLWHEHERLRRRKRRYAFAGALTALTFTGVISVPLAQLLWPQSQVITILDADGRTWRLSGTYSGIVRLQDAQGRILTNGYLRVDFGDGADGVLNIDVAGEHGSAQGPGDHFLHNDRGDLICTVYLDTITSTYQNAQMAKALRSSPAVMISGHASPWGADGRDGTHGVAWKMRGRGRVQVQRPGASKPVMQAETGPFTRESLAKLPPEIFAKILPELRRVVDRETPEFTWTVYGRSGKATGYGSHPIKDESGKTVLILKAEPLSKK